MQHLSWFITPHYEDVTQPNQKSLRCDRGNNEVFTPLLTGNKFNTFTQRQFLLKSSFHIGYTGYTLVSMNVFLLFRLLADWFCITIGCRMKSRGTPLLYKQEVCNLSRRLRLKFLLCTRSLGVFLHVCEPTLNPVGFDVCLTCELNTKWSRFTLPFSSASLVLN